MRRTWGALFALGLILVQFGAGLASTSHAAGPSATTWSQSFTWTQDQVDLRTDGAGITRVRFDGASYLAAPGEADLPWVQVRVEVPDGYDVGTWTWNAGDARTLSTGITPSAAAEDRPGVEGGPLVPALSSAALAPAEAATYRGCATQRGVTYASFYLAPLRWTAGDRALSLVEGGTLSVSFVPMGTPRDIVRPERVLPSSLVTSAFRASLHPRVDAAARSRDLPSDPSAANGTGIGRDGISTSPSLEGAPVEYLIITSDSLNASFVPICDWKNETGRSSTIRTVEWIYDHYPQGTDSAEKIRLFIRDAYRFWGTETVLLGGDPSVVPIRYAKSWAWNPLLGGVNIGTDYYYACLDGNWNANGNAVYGEAVRGGFNEISDEIDMMPEVLVGRIPVRTPTEALSYFHKYFKYVKDPEVGPYLKKVLVLGEVLFDDGWVVGDCDTCDTRCAEGKRCVTSDGATDCFPMIDSLAASPRGSFFEFSEYYERDYLWKTRGRPNCHPLNASAVRQELNGGVSFVFHMGHGDQDRWAVGPDRFQVSDFLALNSGDKVNGMAYTINCNSAAVDYECAAEGWINSPNGGGLIYVGSTNLDFPVTARVIREYFFHQWPGDGLVATPGEAFYATAAHFEPDTRDGFGRSTDGTLRFMMYGLIFLGDPELHLYSSLPEPLDASYPAGIQLGRQSTPVAVTRGGAPVENAVVTIYKSGDAVASGLTGVDGNVNLAFHPHAVGNYKLTVTHPDGIPFAGTGLVTAVSNPFLALSSMTVRDLSSATVVGNGDGKLEVGETIELDVSVFNRGGAAASGATAALRLGSDPVDATATIEDGAADWPNVPAGGASTLNSAFRIKVTDITPVRREPVVDLIRIPLLVDFTLNGTTTTDEYTLWAHRTDLLLIQGTPVDETDGDGIPENNENWHWNLEFANRGSGDATHVRARLEAGVPAFIDFRRQSTSLTPAVSGAHAMTAEPFEFTITNANNLFFTLFLEDTLTTPPRLLVTRKLNLVRPARADSVFTSGTQSAILLQWDKPTSTDELRDLWGYRLERATSPTGTFEPIGQGFVEGLFAYSDEGIPPLTGYAYRIAAVDSSGNTSAYSEIGEGSSSPGALIGWPVTTDEDPSKFGGPAIENLNGFGGYEVCIPGDVLYVLGAHGEDYVDGDGSPSTRGKFFEPQVEGFRVWSKPALVDLDPVGGSQDNHPEVILIANNRYQGGQPPSALMVWDYRGNLKWKKDIPGVPLSSPTVADVDGDGSPEIFLVSGSKVYGFRANGNPFKPGSGGLIRDLNSPNGNFNFMYGSISIGDVIGTSTPELVLVARGADADPAPPVKPTKLFVLTPDGADVANFPFSFGDLETDRELSNASPALVDLDGSGAEPRLEVLITTESRIWCLDPDQASRQAITKWSRVSSSVPGSQSALRVGGIELNGSPAVGDITGDGLPEVVYGWSGGRIYVRNAATGDAMPGFSSGTADWKAIGALGAQLGSPVLGDLTGDGIADIVIGDSKGFVWGLTGTGAKMPGFPIVTKAKIGAGLAIWDIDRNSHPNLIICGEKSNEAVVLDFPSVTFDWSSSEDAKKAAYPWPVFRHDAANTGVAGSALVTPVGLQAPSLSASGLSVELNWSLPGDFTRFLIERHAEGEVEWLGVGDYSPSEVSVGLESYRVVDVAPGDGYYAYRVRAIDESGTEWITSESSIVVGAAPLHFELFAARPNPSTGVTRVELELPHQVETTIRLLDATGRSRALLFQGAPPAGRHVFVFEGKDDDERALPAGVYFIEARTVSGERTTQRLVLVR